MTHDDERVRFAIPVDDVRMAVGCIETVREALSTLGMLAPPDVKTRLGILCGELLDAIDLMQKEMP
jgi:hypothetical protein